jgi:hypothetical protein
MTRQSPPKPSAGTGHRYEPVGFCIYCGDKHSELRDEHIIPYAMAGNKLILPQSSCRKCEAVTGKFEQQYLRRTLGLFRNRIGSPTRNPSERSASPVVGIGRRKGRGPLHDSGERIRIPIQDLPTAYLALKLNPPGILLGKQPSETVDGEIWGKTSKGEDALRLVSRRREGLHVASIQPLTFGRFLAKVAHSYAVATLGFESFQPLLLDLIHGKTEAVSYLVGGAAEVPPADDKTFVLRAGWGTIGGASYALVEIRLYAELATPQYLVVAGVRNSDMPVT